MLVNIPERLGFIRKNLALLVEEAEYVRDDGLAEDLRMLTTAVEVIISDLASSREYL